LISKTFGIEGRKLLKPSDDYEALREFNAAYEGEPNVRERLHLAFQELVETDPDLEERLAAMPNGVFSGREKVPDTASGVFFCYRLPALDAESGRFTLSAGTTRWYLYDLRTEEILDEVDDLEAIHRRIESTPATPRVCTTAPSRLVSARDKLAKHIKNTYLKQLDVPLDAPAPALVCWMELNDG
jgi:hypothetical protein